MGRKRSLQLQQGRYNPVELKVSFDLVEQDESEDLKKYINEQLSSAIWKRSKQV